MTWIDAAPAFGSALAFGLLPGTTLSLVLGVRGIALLGSAPSFSITTIALASVVAPWVGLDWGPLPVAFTTLVLALVIAAIRVFWHVGHPHPPLPQDPSRSLRWAGVGLAVAVLLIGARFLFILRDPESISQTYDAIFHLNAVRFVLDTANASSLTLGGLTANEPGEGSFYPAVWHALAALVADTAGSSLPVSVNAVTLMIGAVFWPLGCIFLVRQVVGPRVLGLAAAGVLSASFGAFPYLMVDWGVLYPYLLGLSLLPAALAYVLLAARLSTQPTMRPSRSRLALLGILPGLALAHPSTLLALMALVAPLGLVLLPREHTRLRAQGEPRRRFVLLYVVVGSIYAVAAAVWVILGVGVAYPAPMTIPQALGQVIAIAPGYQPGAWVLSFLMIVGVAVLVRSRAHLWTVYILAVAAMLYLVAASVPVYLVRAAIVGPFYSDPNRLAALLPVAVLPLAVVGVLAVYTRVRAKLSDRPGMTQRKLGIASAVIVSLALIATQGLAVNWSTVQASKRYVMNADSELLTTEELDVLANVPRFVPEDATVAGSPWTGASLVYALADRQALLPHVSGFDTSASQILVEKLHRAGEDPEVCAAAEELEVEYVLDFGFVEAAGDYHDFPGFNRLDASAVVVPVYENGDAGLYRITACD